MDNENCSWQYNIDNGLVYDWTDYDNFSYKGAVSTNCDIRCPFLFTSIVVGKIYGQIKYKKDMSNSNSGFVIPENIRRSLAGSFASLLTGIAVTITLTTIAFIGTVSLPAIVFSIVVVSGLIYLAYELNKYQYNNNDNKAKEETLIDILSSL